MTTSNQFFNRKLLVSVFTQQEAREAVLGGARIIDSEDPRSALGNIKPRNIMDISNSVLNYNRNFEVQLSTNIGEDQLLFDRAENGRAVEKLVYEMAGKAAQAAIGVAISMGTKVHPCNIIKVGVDGMPLNLVKEILHEVVATVRNIRELLDCQIMSVLFAQDIDLWNNRKNEKEVINNLVELREFHSADPNDSDVFDLIDYSINTLRDENGNILFKEGDQVTLEKLKEYKILPSDISHSYVKLNELHYHKKYFPNIDVKNKTNKEVIKAMVDVSAEAGVNSIMIDTQIQTKVARISLADTSTEGFIDLNKFDKTSNERLTRAGILSLEELKFFVDYCHYKGIEANIAGSLQSYQAQQLWILIPELDQVSTRGGSSAISINPYSTNATGTDTRQFTVIKRNLVKGLIPPEQGGILNIPISMSKNPEAMEAISKLMKMIEEKTKDINPYPKFYFVDKYGEQTQIA